MHDIIEITWKFFRKRSTLNIHIIHKFRKPVTSNRRSRYDSRSVQRPRSLTSQRHRIDRNAHRYLLQSADIPTSAEALSQLHRIAHATHASHVAHSHGIPTNATPPPPSDSDVAEDQFILHNRNLNININNNPLRIPNLHRLHRSSSNTNNSSNSNSNNNNNDDNNDTYANIQHHASRSASSYARRPVTQLLASQLLHRSAQHQYSSPPPPNNTILQLGHDNEMGLLPVLLCPYTVVCIYIYRFYVFSLIVIKSCCTWKWSR